MTPDITEPALHRRDPAAAERPNALLDRVARLEAQNRELLSAINAQAHFIATLNATISSLSTAQTAQADEMRSFHKATTANTVAATDNEKFLFERLRTHESKMEFCYAAITHLCQRADPKLFAALIDIQNICDPAATGLVEYSYRMDTPKTAASDPTAS